MMWTEGDGSPSKLKWRIYPTPPGGGERIFKEGNLEDVSGLLISASPPLWRSPLSFSPQ
jgi:hypothetical protein